MSDGREAVTETADSKHWGEQQEVDGILVLRWLQAGEPAMTALSRSSLVIGRDATCGAPIEGLQVSRRHAEIRFTSGDYLLSDLSSKNGVFHNGKRVSTAVVRSGDVVRIGDRVAIAERVQPDGLSGFGCLAEGLWGGALLRRAAQRTKQVASEAMPIVFQGETGSGKERFARAIHDFSKRGGPFLAVNCAAYTTSTATAELFGYRRGAFTGAEHAHPGHIRSADGGTLLLDEVADLSLETQAALLRAIERREVLPLGESRAIGVDVRFLATTQAPLEQSVAAGRFRADLRARLEGLVIEIPALRARRADIYPLFRMFLDAHSVSSSLEPLAIENLCLYDWPLNVRELQAAAQRLASLHGREPFLLAAHLRDIGIPTPSSAGPAASEGRSFQHGPGRRAEAYEPSEIDALLAALAGNRGNLAEAARQLGLTRSKAQRMMVAAKRRGGAGR